MTREEAIKRFETLLLHVDTNCVMGMETTEAINMAIKALEQPEEWMEQNKDRILKAGMEGREVEFRIGGRLFAIREKDQ